MSLNNAEGARRGASSSRMPDTEASQLEKLQKAIGYARAQLRLKDEENAQLKDDNKAQEFELQLLRSELAKLREEKNEGRPSSRSLQEKDENEEKRNLAALSFSDALSKAIEPQKRRRSKHS
jgi:chromosome segregation ATPase